MSAPVTRRLVMHADAQGWWIEVPVHELEALGIDTQISERSKRTLETAYLVDSDAQCYLDAMNATGTPCWIKLQRTDKPSHIRKMPAYWHGPAFDPTLYVKFLRPSDTGTTGA